MQDNISNFKILSIDGGGIRGVIPAKILCDLEEEAIKKDGPEARLCDYFDLVCGTSTGGIIAIGIALGMTAKEILNLYMKNATKIFPKKNIITSFTKNTPFYEKKPLEELLQECYGGCTRNRDNRIPHCRTRLCIPTYDLDKGEVHVFKTDHLPQYHRDCHVPVVDVALATAAAPVYFSPHTFQYEDIGTTNTNTFTNNIDGGVLANNPALIGLAEAQYCIGHPLENIEMLSLGTGSVNLKENRTGKKMGVRYWIHPKSEQGLRIYEVMSSAQSLFIDNMMKMIFKGAGHGGKQRFKYVRAQKALDTNLPLDTTNKHSLDRLLNIGQELYKEHGELMKPFLDNKIIPYEHQA